jgi:hypothetical protein
VLGRRTVSSLMRNANMSVPRRLRCLLPLPCPLPQTPNWYRSPMGKQGHRAQPACGIRT